MAPNEQKPSQTRPPPAPKPLPPPTVAIKDGTRVDIIARVK